MQDLLMQRLDKPGRNPSGAGAPPDWLRIEANGGRLVVRCKVQPRSSRSEWSGFWEGPEGARVKIRLMAPPVDGEANAALLEFIRKELDLPGGRVSLLRGHQSREKDVAIERIDVVELIQKLEGKVAGRKNGGA